MDFKLHAPYSPTGDQPEAIRALARGVQEGMPAQVLLGVTGSGKTFTMASVIEKLNRPTLVLAHNKTLAAQLCSEFREFFPENAVEYFITISRKPTLPTRIPTLKKIPPSTMRLSVFATVQPPLSLSGAT